MFVYDSVDERLGHAALPDRDVLDSRRMDRPRGDERRLGYATGLPDLFGQRYRRLVSITGHRDRDELLVGERVAIVVDDEPRLLLEIGRASCRERV